MAAPATGLPPFSAILTGVASRPKHNLSSARY